MKCSGPGCEKDAMWRGMCSAHYQKWQKSTPKEKRPKLTPPMRHAELVGLFGGVRPFCRAVGIDPVTFYRWPATGVPKSRQADVMAGAARAGVNTWKVERLMSQPAITYGEKTGWTWGDVE